MLPLDKDLQTKKISIHQFYELTLRVIDYLPNVLSGKEEKGKYWIFNSNIAGTEKFVRHPIKVIGIFLNDVQRKQKNNISHTLVSGLFMVYTNFLVKLDGIYYLDPPPNASRSPYNKHMHKFSKLMSEDIHRLLST